MDLTTIFIVLGVAVIVVTMLVVYLMVQSQQGSPILGQRAAVSDNFRALVSAQREQRKQTGKRSGENLALAAAAENRELRKTSSATSRLTLEKKIRYATWVITPAQFRGIQAVVTILIALPVYLRFGWILFTVALILSPLLVGAVLDYAMNKRFKAFDKDYPAFLMSYVGLLKTGLNAVAGLEAAARGLDEGSLVRQEVELLIERLRLGLNEEQAINGFGEDIHHEEIELFVQSLILNRRLGGTLSATLERLATQVRKRQHFRNQAVAAVGLERNSIYMIAGIMTLLMGYLAYASPELVLPAFSHPLGKNVTHFGISLVFVGFYWSKQVTKIRV